MVNAKEYAISLSGEFFVIGAMVSVYNVGVDGKETLTFGMFTVLGTTSLIAGLLVKNHVKPEELKKVAYLVIIVAVLPFAVSALIDWQTRELLIPVRAEHIRQSFTRHP